MPDNDRLLSASDLWELVETGRELASQVDLRALLDRMLSTACRLTDSPAGAVILHNPDRDVLYFAAATGSAATQLLAEMGEHSDGSVPIEGSHAGLVFRTGESIIRKQVAGDAEHYAGVDQATGTTTQSMLCVPLSMSDERLGVMQLVNKTGGDYTQRDRQLLECFATQAAIAIRNARLFKQMVAHMGMYGLHGPHESILDISSDLRRPPWRETLTVMFADMRGFTQLCNILNDLSKVQHYLEMFLDMLSERVLSHGGVVNKFLGDGMLALFRGSDHSRRAVTCALEVVDAFDVIRARWDATSDMPLDFLDVGIGIVTDEMNIGPLGSAKVRDFTAFGVPVNLASVFVDDARGGNQILANHATYMAVQDLVDSSVRPDTVQLKKTDQTVNRPYKRYLLRRKSSQSDRATTSDSQLITPGPKAAEPAAVWRRKLAQLQTEEAVTSDAATKFQLAELIREAQEKILELEQ